MGDSMQSLLNILISLVLGGMLWKGGITHAQCPAPDEMWSRFERTEVQMGVPFRLIVYATDEPAANKALDAAFKRIEELNDIYSDYDSDSELSRLSRSSGSGKAVPVSSELLDILQISHKISQKTEGAFDITVGPAVRLWRRARRQKLFPDSERLKAARQAIGYQHMLIDPAERTVTLQRDQMRLDLGGIAKGYAADEALRVLRQHDIRSALIDASGDLLVGAPPPGKPHWTIGVAALKSPEGEPTEFLKLANRAVATSGDAYQFVEIDGVRYSHIVNPRTGLGLTTPGSVTVVAPTATLADAWASAVSVMGPEQGLSVLSRQDNLSALVLTLQNGETRRHRSCDFPRTSKR